MLGCLGEQSRGAQVRDRDPDFIIAVYIMANRRNGTIYTGVASHLVGRVWQHRNGVVKGFTTEHGCKTLVWFEPHELIVNAIAREKKIKKWKRRWKLALIEARNPQWLDLAAPWFEPGRTEIAQPVFGPYSP